MARLDGMSRELYEGEREAMVRRITMSRRAMASADPVRDRYDMAMRYGNPKDDFCVVEERQVERCSTGFKVLYRSRGVFRG